MLKELFAKKEKEINDQQKKIEEQRKKDIECLWKEAVNSLYLSPNCDKLCGTLNLTVDGKIINVWEAIKFAEDEGLTVEVGEYLNTSNIKIVDFFYDNKKIEVWGTRN